MIDWLHSWKHLRLAASIIFVVSLLLIAHFTGLQEELSLESIKEILRENFWTATVLYILMFTIGNIIQVPGWIFLSASIVTLGKTHGYFLTLAAAIFSTVVGFYLIRLIGGDSLRKIRWKWVQRSLKTIDQHPLKTNILLRIVFQTAPPLNYTLALSGIEFRSYFIGAILGLPLPIYIYTLVINGLADKVF